MSLMFLGGAVSLLKLTTWCTVGGLAVTMARDEDIKKLVKKAGFKTMTKTVNGFDLRNEHTVVIGATQYGKTYATIKTLERLNEPVLFFNTNHVTEDLGKIWKLARPQNTSRQLIHALQNGDKVNFMPDEDIIKAGKQLKNIVDMVYQEGRGKVKFRFAIDEVHLFKLLKSQEGQSALMRLATTSLGRGIPCIWISQRPALVDNTLYTQATKHIIFTVGKMDEAYMREAKFPMDEIRAKTNGQKYLFTEFDQMEVKGAFKVC
jgi:hypothetical protein